MNQFLRAIVFFAMVGASSAGWAAESGQHLYQMHCANCHGITGIPVMPQVPNLAMREGMNKPDFVLIQSLKTGGRSKPPFLGILTDKELQDVIQYVRMMR